MNKKFDLWLTRMGLEIFNRPMRTEHNKILCDFTIYVENVYFLQNKDNIFSYGYKIKKCNE